MQRKPGGRSEAAFAGSSFLIPIVHSRRPGAEFEAGADNETRNEAGELGAPNILDAEREKTGNRARPEGYADRRPTGWILSVARRSCPHAQKPSAS